MATRSEEPGNGWTPDRARALADPTRFRILHLVADAHEPVGVGALSDALGAHPSGVRYHLARLREAGLVVETSVQSGGRGRPRLAYQVAPGASPGRYERLAGLLAEAVRTKQPARRMGRAAGRRAGEAYAAAGITARPAIEKEAAELGFDPLRLGHDLVLRHCPFANVAAAEPATICQLHLGLAEGLAERLGGVAVAGMVVRDPHRAGCRLQLVDVRAVSTPARATRARRA